MVWSPKQGENECGLLNWWSHLVPEDPSSIPRTHVGCFFFSLVLHYLGSSWKRKCQWRTFPSPAVGKPVGIFLVNDSYGRAQRTVGSVLPRQVGRRRLSKPQVVIQWAVFLHGLCFCSCLQEFLLLLPLMMCCDGDMKTELTCSSPSYI